MAFYTQVVPSSGDAQKKLAKIQRTHLSYLQLDENKEKLQKRSDLEDLITTHVSTVPHREKFPCPKFLEVLRRSVENNSDLKANKASRAFDALEKYAVNLLCQPWRQEYRCIRLYNGFFQHHIDTHLSNAIEVLHLMGYENSSKMEVMLSEPIDPDRVIDVSLNCLIAAVECQIMMQVMERTGGCYSLREIAYVRRHNVCDVLKTVALLTGASKRSRNIDSIRHDKSTYQADPRIRPPNRSNGYVKVEKLVDVPCDWIDSLADTMEADAMYPEISYGLPWASQKQLRNGHSFDCGISKPMTTDEHIATIYNGLNYLPRNQRVFYDPETRADSWGYVDQSLERKGYNKDHGERGDLLKCGPDLVRSTNARKPGFQSSNYANLQMNPAKAKPIGHPQLKTGVDPYRGMSSLYNGTYDENETNPAKAKSGFGAIGHPQLKTGVDPFCGMPPLYQPLAFNENEMRKMSHPFPAVTAGMTHRFPLTENLINFENQYVNPYYLGACVGSHPKISAGHVCRTNVPYGYAYPSYPAMTTSVAFDAHSPRSQASQTRTAAEKQEKMVAGKAENRRSWYDNVVQGNGDEKAIGDIDRTVDNGPGMPAANNVIAHLCEQIVLPPPTPFQTESVPIVPDSAPLRQAKLMHRRGASDGVTEISVADGVTPVSVMDEKPDKLDKMDKSNSLDVGPASRKSSASSGERRSIRDEKPSSKEALPTPRRGSSLLRHERSPSAGSIRSASHSSSGGGSSAPSQGKWSCWACTYLNGAEVEICEMCSRSRNRGAESSPLTSGGHECQQCTLVNEKGVVKCIACGQSLENSPTYVCCRPPETKALRCAVP